LAKFSCPAKLGGKAVFSSGVHLARVTNLRKPAATIVSVNNIHIHGIELVPIANCKPYIDAHVKRAHKIAKPTNSTSTQMN
jgi:hypothetical protein